MNKLIAIAAGVSLATIVLTANAGQQPRQKRQQGQQPLASIEQNASEAEQAHWKRRRDRDDHYWDDGYWDNGRWYPYHHRHYRHNDRPGFFIEFP